MNLPETKKQNYAAVDVARFICALLVVLFHCPPVSWGGEVTGSFRFVMRHLVCRIPLPFFFMCSGFFLFQKTGSGGFDWRPVKASLRKNLRLYIIWACLYLPFNIYELRYNDYSGYLQAGVIYVRNFIFSGSYFHLWYIPALMVAVALTAWLLSKGWRPRTILLTAFLLYLIGLSGESWFGLIRPLEHASPTVWMFLKGIEKIMMTTRNGVFFGFLFVSIGMALGRGAHERPNTGKVIFLTAMLIVSLMMLYVETCYTVRHHLARAFDMFLFLVPVSVLLFYLLLQVRLRPHNIYKRLRTWSAVVYFIHPMIGYYLVDDLLALTGLTGHLRGTVMTIATMIISVIASELIIRLAQTKRLSFLRYLYS